MARVGRLAGAILAETAGRWFLIGDLKEPCDFTRAGFEHPGPIEPLVRPYVELVPRGNVELPAPWLEMAVEGEPLAALLAERFLIQRNGSVSQRLWRLVLSPDGSSGENEVGPVVDARWLGEIPAPVWQVVRDGVLKCL